LAGTTQLTTVRVASGLSLPLYVTAPPGDTSRAFIVEQRSGTTGRIRVLQLPSNTLLTTPFLSVSPVSTGDEQGLLGLAFHPNYNDNGYFWINYTDSGGTTRVVRYQASPPSSNTANAASATTVLSISQPFSNHNGGWLGFGPDGYLYISTGDGGSANDPGNRAQNLTLHLGKMLRIDVDGADDIPGNDDDDGVIGSTLAPYTNPPDNPFYGATTGLDEIWAYGLRNPWRCSFDRLTGDLWIGDVGQGSWEEIDFQPAGSSGGENYGWRCMEGNHCTGLTGCTCDINCGGGLLVCPIHEYSHSTDGFSCSITGGYVYRGCAMPDMNGIYFFADYCSDHIKSFRYSPGSGITEFTDRTTELDPAGATAITDITSFGEDAYGELYITDRNGEVFKIISLTAEDCNANAIDDTCELAGNDCNNNGKLDECDIAAGDSDDINGNGIPDECECLGDLDGDGSVGLADLSALLTNYGTPSGATYADGDIDGDGDVDLADLSALLTNYGLNC
jgi:hypothetical protein